MACRLQAITKRPDVSIVYLGCATIAAMRAHITLPKAIISGLGGEDRAYTTLFEQGMELSPGPSGLDRVWLIGRAARPGDPATMTAAEADRRSGSPSGH